MPKEPKDKRSLIKKWCNIIEDKCFQFNGQELFCIYCEKKVTSNRKSSLTQHIQTELHKEMKCTYYQRKTDDTDRNLSCTQNSFELELCEALAAANIPWNVLNNETFNSFLSKYTQQDIQDEHAMRTLYLDKCHQRKIEEIRSTLSDHYVWISIDETVDDYGRYFANLVMGNLNENEIDGHFYLLASKHLEQVNNGTISRFVNKALRSLWPDGNEDHVMLLVTNEAEYMLMAGENLKVFYPNMIHITCVAQGLNTAVENIKYSYPLVDSLVCSVKSVFTKNPYRIAVYKKMMNNVELPPEDNWLEAVVFYANNYEGIKQVLQHLNADANAFTTTKAALDILQNDYLFKDLIFLKSNLYRFIEIVESLEESQGISLKESFRLFNEALAIINSISPGALCDELRYKLNLFLKRNPDFDTIVKVNNILNNNLQTPCELQSIAEEYIIKYRYAPLTVYNVERSFPAFKQILSENVQYLSVDNLEKMLVINC